jgi:K+/H+ antiporter YhaU regulatory subunit KhtT
MIAILSLLLVVAVSILVTRIATIALIHTGLSRESARFQARSAFTGAGFTTSESETVVNHPVRRRIIMLLMMMGNAGIVTAMSSLILTFVGQGAPYGLGLRVLCLTLGLVVVWLVARSTWIDRRLSQLIDRLLRKFAHLELRDYASLMRLAGDYRLAEMEVETGDWVAGETLAESRLRDEGIMVLGIRRLDGSYVGAPQASTQIRPHDVLIMYGRVAAIEEVDARRRDARGDMAHAEAVHEQQKVVEQEQRVDSSDSGQRTEAATTENAAPTG